MCHEDKDAQVRIETDQEDRFFLTVGVAIEACKAYGKQQEFLQQFREVQSRLSQWVKQHGSLITDAYLTVQDAALLFLVVMAGAAFDQALEDSLTDLDIAIAQDASLDLIQLNVLALPRASEEVIQSFLVSGSANV